MATPPWYWLQNTATALSPISQPSYSTEEYNTSGQLSKYTIWKEAGKTTKLMEATFTYSSDEIATETVITYNNGAPIETRVYSYTHNVGPPTAVDRILQ